MRKFVVTFGQKYRREPHPKVKYADPDGYVVIIAKNMEQAREKAFDELGQYWAFIYEKRGFDDTYYPKGVLKTIK